MQVAMTVICILLIIAAIAFLFTSFDLVGKSVCIICEHSETKIHEKLEQLKHDNICCVCKNTLDSECNESKGQ